MDKETIAMAKLVEALADLEPDVTVRVLRWAAERYGGAAPAPAPPLQATSEERGSQFSDLASLYDTADPMPQAEKALVVAYWFQVLNGQDDWESQAVNTELKNLGHGVKNITDVLNSLIDQKPRLVLQTRKAGSSKQARKRYKLTLEGIRRVQQMLKRSDAGSGGDPNGSR